MSRQDVDWLDTSDFKVGKAADEDFDENAINRKKSGAIRCVRRVAIY